MRGSRFNASKRDQDCASKNAKLPRIVSSIRATGRCLFSRSHSAWIVVGRETLVPILLFSSLHRQTLQRVVVRNFQTECGKRLYPVFVGAQSPWYRAPRSIHFATSNVRSAWYVGSKLKRTCHELLYWYRQNTLEKESFRPSEAKGVVCGGRGRGRW